MSRDTGNQITVEAVEALIDRRRRALPFPEAVESQFERDTRGRRCRRLKVGILVSAALYNLFLISDCLLVPDVLTLATILHICVVTPWMLIAARIVSRHPTPRVREWVAASIPLLIIVQIEIGFASTASATAEHYQYVILPTLLYTNVSLHRLTFPLARFVTATAVICHTLVVLSASYISPVVAIMIIIQLFTFAYITLVANYTLERDWRRSYLFSLRDRLRHSDADAVAKHDPLTGLANRHYLELELDALWGDETAFVSVILFDLDHFKLLNDRYGHAAGDLCLKRVAAILMDELKATAASPVRYGGEEFLVVLPDVALVDAMRIAERIRRAIEAAAIPNDGMAPSHIITASFGVAATAVRDLSGAELIAAADAALYAAKHRGRNQIWPPLAAPAVKPDSEIVRLREQR